MHDESLSKRRAQELRIAAAHGLTLLKQACDYLVSEGVCTADMTAENVLEQWKSVEAGAVNG